MDEHSYNHIEVVCTLHCQIFHHDYQLSQYNVTILPDCFHMPYGTLMFFGQ